MATRRIPLPSVGFRRTTAALVAAVVLISLSACTSEQPASDEPEAGEPLIVDVDPGQPLDLAVPEVGRLTAPVGTFTAPGQLTVTTQDADLSELDLVTAGSGVDLTFTDTTLAGPVTVAFTVGGPPEPDALPIVGHQADDGSWDVIPAQLDADGDITVSTQDFSLVLPGWANPARWWGEFTDRLASLVGGRTDELTCSGPPGWFHLDARHSDLVHSCATSNRLDDGTEVAEVQIKSNRGVSVEVTVPGEPEYVYVEGAPWPYRQAVAGWVGFDPNRTVILAAGATMTVGYRQGYTSAPVSFFVSGATGWAFTDTVTRELIEFAVGELSEATFLTFMAQVSASCIAGLEVGLSGAGLDPQDFIAFVGCLTGEVVDELRDEGKAIRMASNIGVQPNGREVADRAEKLGGLGWLVTLWPAFQAGWGNVIDKVRELASDGETALVTYRTDPIPTPAAADGDVLRFDGIDDLTLFLTAADLTARGYVNEGNLYEGMDAECVSYADPDGGPRVSVESATGRVLAINNFDGDDWRTEVGNISAGDNLADVRAAFTGPDYKIEEFLNSDFGQGANGVVVTHDGGAIGLSVDGDGDSAEVSYVAGVGLPGHAPSLVEDGC